MVDEISFVDIRDPEIGELAPGKSSHKIGIDSHGERWVIRRGPDEAFAYVLSERYFGKVVPHTVLVKRYGTAQRLFSNVIIAQQADWAQVQKLRLSPTFLTGLAGMACLDVVIKNRDRHANNWGFSDDGRVYAFDNEVSSDALTLRQCLRPVYRCVLADDPDLSPMIVNTMSHMFAIFTRDIYLLQVEKAMADLGQWKLDLSTFRGI